MAVPNDAAVDANARTLPQRAKIGWGIGGAAEAWMAGGIGQFTGPIYTIALHLSPAKLGLIGSFPRLLDAIYDIWLGNLSDNTRTRWGRRRPFIAIGTILSALFFVAIGWVPLGLTANGQLAYFTAASMGYWLAFGTYAIPFNALGYELTNDYDERTSVQAHRYFSIQVAGLILGALYPLCFAKIFTTHVPAGVAPEVIGARWVSFLFGAMILLAGLAPVIASRENPVNESHPRVPLLLALKLTFSDRLFLHFMAMIIVSISGVSIAGGLGLIYRDLSCLRRGKVQCSDIDVSDLGGGIGGRFNADAFDAETWKSVRQERADRRRPGVDDCRRLGDVAAVHAESPILVGCPVTDLNSGIGVLSDIVWFIYRRHL